MCRAFLLILYISLLFHYFVATFSLLKKLQVFSCSRERFLLSCFLKNTIIIGFFFPDPCIGQALVPYYRQMLPILNLFRNRNIHLGEGIDYDRVGRIGDIIDQTLQKMERCGGTDAYINIKYIIPTYESCVNN